MTTPIDLRAKVAPLAKTDCDYHRGGWMKVITGLDKSRQNGYSLVGDFVERKSGLGLYETGLYLMCDKQGSRNNPRPFYVLFTWDGENVEIVQELADPGRDWALQLWPDVERSLAGAPDERDAAIAEIRRLMSQHAISTDEL